MIAIRATYLASRLPSQLASLLAPFPSSIPQLPSGLRPPRRSFSGSFSGPPPAPPLPPEIAAHFSSLSIPPSEHAFLYSTLKQGGVSSPAAVASFPPAGLQQMLAARPPPSAAPPVDIHINVPHHSSRFSLSAASSSTILDAAASSPVLRELIAGSCGGNMSCSTCHVLLRDARQYERSLDACEPPHVLEEAELDMLELAAGYEEGVSR